MAVDFVLKDKEAMRGGEVVSRRAHNPEVAGSIPAPAIDDFIWLLSWYESQKK